MYSSIRLRVDACSARRQQGMYLVLSTSLRSWADPAHVDGVPAAERVLADAHQNSHSPNGCPQPQALALDDRAATCARPRRPSRRGQLAEQPLKQRAPAPAEPAEIDHPAGGHVSAQPCAASVTRIGQEADAGQTVDAAAALTRLPDLLAR